MTVARLLLPLLALVALTSCNATKPWTTSPFASWAADTAAAPGAKPVHQLVLLGDAGKPSLTAPNPVLDAFGRQLRAMPSTAVYLGDNIYNYGMPAPGHKEYEQSVKRFGLLLDPLKGWSGPAWLMGGNHDWAMGGKEGLGNMIRQDSFARAYTSRAQMMPVKPGCPGPALLKPAPGLNLILIDTQWFIHKYEKLTSGCPCATVEETLDSLGTLLATLPGRTVVLGHHPLYSAGTHGGQIPAYQHLFPLTAIKKQLWIPLPVFGSIYVLFRQGGSSQDIPNPHYQAWRKPMIGILAGHPGVPYIAGHDHTMQYQYRQGTHHFIAGSGAKKDYVKKGKKADFAYAAKGYCTVTLYSDGRLRTDHVKVDETGPHIVFSRWVE